MNIPASPKSANFFIPDGVLYLKDYGYGYFDDAGNWVYWYPDDFDFHFDKEIREDGLEMHKDEPEMRGDAPLHDDIPFNSTHHDQFLADSAYFQGNNGDNDLEQTQEPFEQLVGVDDPWQQEEYQQQQQQQQPQYTPSYLYQQPTQEHYLTAQQQPAYPEQPAYSEQPLYSEQSVYVPPAQQATQTTQHATQQATQQPPVQSLYSTPTQPPPKQSGYSPPPPAAPTAPPVHPQSIYSPPAITQQPEQLYEQFSGQIAERGSEQQSDLYSEQHSAYTTPAPALSPAAVPVQQQYDPSLATNQQQYDPILAPNQQQYDPILATNQQQYDPILAPNQQQYDPSLATNQQQYDPILATNQQQYDPILATNQQQYDPILAPNQQQYDPSLATNQQQYEPRSNCQTPHPTQDTFSNAPIVSFGFGGKLVIHNPSTPIASPFTPSTLGMSQPTPSTVNIAELASVLPPDLSPPFPGPLLGNSHTTKSQVLRYLDNKISTGATYPKMALLKVLRVMLIHDGILSSRQSEEIRDALISDDINAHSHKRAPSGLQITVPADETSPHMKPFPSSQTPYAVEDSADIVATYCTTTGHLGAIQQFLVKGAKREAVMYALEHKLWSHALLISSCVDRQLWSEVVSALIAYELPSSSGSGNDNTGSTHNTKNWDSLRVAYGLFAGTLRSTNTPSDTRNWSATAATLVSNLDNSDAQHALSELGDRLAEVGEVDGAHTVYILAQSVDKVRLNLVGCAHNAYSDESCEMSEILEYALSLNPHMKAHVKRGEYSGMPHLQIYKLVHAWHLAEAGRLHDANRYCEAIATSIKMSKQLQYHPNIYIQLKELSDRLAAHLHTADKSWLTKKIARPSLDTLWNSMEGKLTKFIAGNDEEGENAITTHAQKTTQDDPFATFTSIDESSTNGRLSRAVSAFDLPNYSNAAGENAGAGMSEGMSLLDRRASHSPSYLTPGIASGAAGARSALGQPRAASAMGGLGGVATANANTIANGLGNMHNLLRDLPSPMEGEDREGFTRAAVTPPFSDEFNGVGVAQDGEMLGKDLQNVQMPLQTSMQPHPATQQMQPPPPPPPAQMQPPPPPPLAQPVRNVSPAQQQSQSQSQSQLKPHPQPPSSHSQPPPPPAQPAITSPFGHSTSASEDFNAPEELDESEGGNFVSLMDSMDVPIPTTTTENSNANAYISPRVIDEIDEADELEDDLGFGNSSTKKAKEMREKDNEGHHGEEEKTAATYQPPPPPPPAPAPGKQEKSGWFSRSTTPASTPRMDEKMEKEGENKESKGRQEKRPELKQSVSSSWLSRWWKKDEQNTNQGGGPVKAKLGEQSSFYYDPDQKRWVNKANESGSEGGTAASPRMPPPPPRSSTVSPGLAGTRGASALKNSVSMDLKGESGSGSGAGVMPPPPPRPLSTAITGTPAGTPAGTPPTPNAPQPTQPIQRKGKKAARNKYVAVNM